MVVGRSSLFLVFEDGDCFLRSDHEVTHGREPFEVSFSHPMTLVSLKEAQIHHIPVHLDFLSAMMSATAYAVATRIIPTPPKALT